jgi:exopolysaccharide biosynthesis polyprenyl glycosylphosphotransferase
MIRQNKYIYLFYLFIDLVLISICFYASFHLNLSVVPQDPEARKLYLTVFIIWTICLIYIFNIFSLYRTPRETGVINEIFTVFKGVAYSSVLGALFIFILKINIFSRAIFLESAFFLVFALSMWRLIKRLLIRQLISRGYLNHNVLIIGVNKETEILIQEALDNPHLGLKIAGLLDNDRTGDFFGFKILGGLDKIEYAVKKYFIDEIFITEKSCGVFMRDIIMTCVSLEKNIRILIDDFNLSSPKLNLSYLGSFPLLTYYQEEGFKLYIIFKQVMDFFISGILLFLLIPVFMIITCLIKLEGGGPVFYSSRRSGKKGKAFNCYKFRSMVDKAEDLKQGLRPKSEVDGPIFKIKEDPRITRIGRFLRRYSLDELPQLFNVFMGDMSLVGPRPFPVEESDKIEYRHISRLNIRPGITGLAQIKGRSDLKFNNWMRWDAWYANNLSIGLDIKILLWTIPAVIRAKGVY